METSPQDARAGIDLPADLPQALVDLRVRLGLSQAGLARHLRVSLPTVRRWEAGEARPTSLPVKARISNALRLSMPVEYMQSQVQGMAEVVEGLRALAQGPNALSPSGLVDTLLEMLDQPGFVEQLEVSLRAQFRMGADPFIAALAGALDGTELAGVPEAARHRIEADVVRPMAILLVGSLRGTLLDARTNVHSNPGGDSHASDSTRQST